MNILDALYAVDDSHLVSLPSGTTIIVREMTGKDQRAFSDKGKVQSGQAINELLASCILSINEEDMPTDEKERLTKVTNMLSGDRQVAVFHIRKLSLGKTFEFTAKCPDPDCRKESSFEVSLDEQEFPITPYAHGTDETGEFTIELVEGQPMRFSFKFITGKDEMAMIKNRKNMNALSDLDMRQLKVWMDDKWVPVAVDKLGKAIKPIRDAIRKQEGTIDSAVEVTCPHCQSEAKFHLLMLPDFLIPTGH